MHMADQKRIVITGMGAVTPIGIGVETYWNSLISGVCGIGPLNRLDTADLPVKIGGEIRFKTDDDALFEESIEYFEECGFGIDYITRDLHNSDFDENIMTEHEKMFSEEGINIKFLIARMEVSDKI